MGNTSCCSKSNQTTTTLTGKYKQSKVERPSRNPSKILGHDDGHEIMNESTKETNEKETKKFIAINETISDQSRFTTQVNRLTVDNKLVLIRD